MIIAPFRINSENNFNILDKDFAALQIQLFEADKAQSRLLTLKDLRWGIFGKMYECFAGCFRSQLRFFLPFGRVAVFPTHQSSQLRLSCFPHFCAMLLRLGLPQEVIMHSTKTVLLAAIAATLAAGCSSRRVVVHQSAGATSTVVTRPVVTTPTPPTAPIEEMGPAPRPDSAWVPGYWKRSGSRWGWVQGHWQSLPRGYNTYIPGHWEKQSGAWVYYRR